MAQNGVGEMRCRYNTIMYPDGIVREFILHMNRLAHSERLSQCAEQSARLNTFCLISYSRMADPHIEREVQA